MVFCFVSKVTSTSVAVAGPEIYSVLWVLHKPVDYMMTLLSGAPACRSGRKCISLRWGSCNSSTEHFWEAQCSVSRLSLDRSKLWHLQDSRCRIDFHWWWLLVAVILENPQQYWWLWNCPHRQNYASGQNTNYGWGKTPAVCTAHWWFSIPRRGRLKMCEVIFQKWSLCTANPPPAQPWSCCCYHTKQNKRENLCGSAKRAKYARQERSSGERKVPE